MDQERKTEVKSGSRIGQSIKIEGKIESREDLIIDGQVEGHIILDDHRLIISPSARIKGNINTRDIILEGNMEGNIIASGKVVILAKASLIGDITAGRVAIEEGAKFKGTIKIIPGR
ncbi:MAG: polymer-forming cytoskeletal protein [Candidatus Aminicenantes bacterium]|nr:polymer-forming cytoskeletal protein [Candidatus Aminicenantes bacterium]